MNATADDIAAEHSIRIDGSTIALPPGHTLPQLRTLMPTYDAHLGWIIRAIGEADPTGCFIDIGANVGDTAAMLRANATNPLLCVEGNGTFASYLRRNLAHLPGRATAVEAFVRVAEIDEAGLSYSSGSSTGAFGRTEDARTEVAMIDLPDIVAQAIAAHGRIALLKTDTDGLDAFILRDALQQPTGDAVLFFECDEANTIRGVDDAPWAENFAALRQRGYSLIVYDNHGLPMLFAGHEQFGMLEDLRFYLRQQYAAGAVRIHYLDIWAFPPARRSLFERLRDDRDRLFF